MIALGSARGIASNVARPTGQRSAIQNPLASPQTSRPCQKGGPCCGGCIHRQGGTPHQLHHKPRPTLAPPPEAVGIYYSTATGKTQEVADKIHLALGDDGLEPVDIGDVEDLNAALSDPSLDGLIVGAPTWNTGADDGRSGTAWDDVLAQIAALKLTGVKVAVFGLGDMHGYGDYFCDAMEELFSTFKAAGCDMVGTWPTEGYEHTESKAEIEPGTFCGLALDEDNQGELTDARVAAWTAQVMAAMKAKAAATA